MSSVTLRSTLITRGSRKENEVGVRKPLGKTGMLPPGVGGLKTRPVRGAMQDIGNKAVTLRDTSSKAIKPEPAVKATRGLTKQKAAVSLKNVAVAEQPTRVQPKRKSAEKSVEKEREVPEPMEISKLIDMKLDDVEMEEGVSAFSADRMLLVEDIDAQDASDPQLVSGYVNQIYTYLRRLENEQSVAEDYLGNKNGGVIVPKMRSVLIDWLVDVHQQFSMLQETLYLTVAILDRFLQKSASEIPKKSLQLVGVTAMFIASKYEEMYAPVIADFVYITDNAYTESQIRRMEIEILRVLNFDLGRPLPLHFLRRNSKAGSVDARVHTLAKYILELTIMDYNLVHVAPSKLAAACLLISQKFFDEDNGDKPLEEYWTPTLAYYSMYEWSDLVDTVIYLLNMVVTVSQASADAKLMAVRTKYSNKKFGRMAIFAQSRVTAFELMKPEAKLRTSTPK